MEERYMEKMVMPKGVISNRIYLPKTPELFDHCLKELTYQIPNPRPMVPPEIYNDLSLISPTVFSIPVGRRDLVPDNLELVDKRVLVPVDLPAPTVELREDQEDIYALVEDNCLINAKPGWGKTFVSLLIAHKLGQKTLVVVHNTTLRDQWVQEVEKVFGFEPGIIGTGRFETKTPIVVSNTQTLTKHIQKYSKMFGTMIVDECHRIPATTFKNIADASYARYKIGLSATIRRKDNKHVYIPDYFSLDRYIPLVDTAMKPSILCIYTNLELKNKLGHWVKKITDLLSNPEYIQLVCDIADIKSNVEKYKVLVVGDRLEFLEECSNRVANSRLVTSYVPNRMGIHQEIIDGKANSIFGTTSIYKEGVNIPPLSCLILGSPINNDPLLEQIIGRVTRPCPGKPQPLIIDLVLKDRTSRRQFGQRLNYYISKGYKIKEVHLD